LLVGVSRKKRMGG